VTELDAAPSDCCTPSTRTDVSPPELAACSANPAIGFLAFLEEHSGLVGGYLLTNAWGRPLEFRLSSAVQPTRVQQILYGPTLADYLHGELLGKTLVEKAGLLPGLIIADRLPALSLRNRLNVPVIAVCQGIGEPDGEVISFRHDRCSTMLVLDAKHAADRDAIEARLERIDTAVDLAEPFARIREAVAEARKTGSVNRAA